MIEQMKRLVRAMPRMMMKKMTIMIMIMIMIIIIIIIIIISSPSFTHSFTQPLACQLPCFIVAFRMLPMSCCKTEDPVMWNAYPALNEVQSTERELPCGARPSYDQMCFSLDKTFTGSAKNRVVYESVASVLVSSVIAGSNATVVAYGTPGSGKTFLLQGSEEEGVLQMSAYDIFGRIGEAEDIKSIVSVSYIEIRDDGPHNLLEEETTSSDPLFVSSYDELMKAVVRGQANLSRPNATTLFRISIESKGAGGDRQASLNIVELAGSCGDER
jgi:Kinesin motor domain